MPGRGMRVSSLCNLPSLLLISCFVCTGSGSSNEYQYRATVIGQVHSGESVFGMVEAMSCHNLWLEVSEAHHGAVLRAVVNSTAGSPFVVVSASVVMGQVALGGNLASSYRFLPSTTNPSSKEDSGSSSTFKSSRTAAKNHGASKEKDSLVPRVIEASTNGLPPGRWFLGVCNRGDGQGFGDDMPYQLEVDIDLSASTTRPAAAATDASYSHLTNNHHRDASYKRSKPPSSSTSPHSKQATAEHAQETIVQKGCDRLGSMLPASSHNPSNKLPTVVAIVVSLLSLLSFIAGGALQSYSHRRAMSLASLSAKSIAIQAKAGDPGESLRSVLAVERHWHQEQREFNSQRKRWVAERAQLSSEIELLKSELRVAQSMNRPNNQSCDSDTSDIECRSRNCSADTTPNMPSDASSLQMDRAGPIMASQVQGHGVCDSCVRLLTDLTESQEAGLRLQRRLAHYQSKELHDTSGLELDSSDDEDGHSLDDVGHACDQADVWAPPVSTKQCPWPAGET